MDKVQTFWVLIFTILCCVLVVNNVANDLEQSKTVLLYSARFTRLLQITFLIINCLNRMVHAKIMYAWKHVKESIADVGKNLPTTIICTTHYL